MPIHRAAAMYLLLAVPSASQQLTTPQGSARQVVTTPSIFPTAGPGPETLTSRTVVFKKGTEVHLRLAETLSSKTSVVGHLVELVLDEDLKVEDIVLATMGSRVIGKVTQGKSDEKKRAGKDLAIQLQYVVTPYGRLPLTGEQRGATKRNTAAIVASTAAFGLTGLLVALETATKKILPENTPVVAASAEDFEVTITPVSGPSRAKSE